MIRTLLSLVLAIVMSQLAPVDGVEWVHFPAGSFQMGCVPRDKHCAVDEKPRHRVRLTRAFDLMATEATVAMFEAYAASTHRPMPPQPDDLPTGPDHPAVNLTYPEAEAFCAWVGGRIPTEAEWEYAARKGQDGIYPWGDDVEPTVKGRPVANISDAALDRAIPNPFPTVGVSVKWYDDGYAYTSPVRAFPPNKSGLYDIGGNASEWVDGSYGWNGYKDAAATDPEGSHGRGTGGLLRGGAWNSYPYDLRTSFRYRNDFDMRMNNAGVRCARSGR